MQPQQHDDLARQLAEETLRLDELALVVLKGHLIIEQLLFRAIGKFVHHARHLPERLTFPLCVGLARSMSLDRPDDPMWDIVLAINALRNQIAHSLDSPERAKAYEKFRQVCAAARGGKRDEGWDPHHVVLFAQAECLGFLAAFEAEVERFRELVSAIDRVANPQRHGDNAG